jgi:energy-converting hydrogenase Eha subunit A
LVAGILYSFDGLIVDTLVSIGWVSSVSASTPGLSFGTVLAFGSLIGMPIIFAMIGFVAGIIEALAYNLFAKWFGEIEIDFKQ